MYVHNTYKQHVHTHMCTCMSWLLHHPALFCNGRLTSLICFNISPSSMKNVRYWYDTSTSVLPPSFRCSSTVSLPPEKAYLFTYVQRISQRQGTPSDSLQHITKSRQKVTVIWQRHTQTAHTWIRDTTYIWLIWKGFIETINSWHLFLNLLLCVGEEDGRGRITGTHLGLGAL